MISSEWQEARRVSDLPVTRLPWILPEAISKLKWSIEQQLGPNAVISLFVEQFVVRSLIGIDAVVGGKAQGWRVRRQ
jgi:hypothetical protein